MQIRRRLQLNSAVVLAIMLVIVASLFWYRREAVRLDAALSLVAEMEKTALERTLLRDAYLAHRSERARLQWQAKTDRFESLLTKAEGLFTGEQEKDIIEEMRRAFGETTLIFGKLVDIGREDDEREAKSVLSSEAEKRLFTQILVKAHALMDQTRTLRESVEKVSDAAHDRVHLFLVAFAIAAVAIVIGNSVFINHLLALRIRRLSEGAEVIGSGNLAYRIPVKGNDELSGLTGLINEMSARLEESHTSIHRLQQEIVERQQVEEELRRLKRELEERVRERTAQLDAANKELEAFSFSVSHDLRAPLRRIDGFSAALLEDCHERLDERGKEYLLRVRKGTEEMGVLIDDLLKLSRVTRVELHLEPVDLGAMAREILEDLRRGNPERPVDLIIRGTITGRGDLSLLRIAVGNLINNAVKFTGKRPDPRIEFGAVKKDGKTVYSIKDNGVGFDMAYADKLFGPFQRLHAVNEFPGTGIGLATVQRVIARHGGTVWAEGTVGEGATFFFTLE